MQLLLGNNDSYCHQCFITITIRTTTTSTTIIRKDGKKNTILKNRIISKSPLWFLLLTPPNFQKSYQATRFPQVPLQISPHATACSSTAPWPASGPKGERQEVNKWPWAGEGDATWHYLLLRFTRPPARSRVPGSRHSIPSFAPSLWPNSPSLNPNK